MKNISFLFICISTLVSAQSNLYPNQQGIGGENLMFGNQLFHDSGFLYVSQPGAAEYPIEIFAMQNSVWQLVDQVQINTDDPYVRCATDFKVKGMVMAVVCQESYGKQYLVILEKENNQWQQKSTFEANGFVGFRKFGGGLAVNSNTVVAATDEYYDSQQEALFVFQKQNSEWTLVQQFNPQNILDANYAQLPMSFFGDQLLIGNPLAQVTLEGEGEIEIYQKVNGFFEFTEAITAPTAVEGGRFGSAIHAYDEHIYVAAPGAMSNQVFQMAYSQDSWSLVESISLGYVSNIGFGLSVAVDGYRMLIGSPNKQSFGCIWCPANNVGMVDYFEFNESQWTHIDSLNSEISIDRRLGSGVALTATKALISGSLTANPDIRQGELGVYVTSDQGLAHSTELLPSLGSAFDNFGKNIVFWNDYAAIVSPGDDDLSHNAGSIYMYQMINGSWDFKQKLYPDVADSYLEKFGLGEAMDMNDGVLVVSSINLRSTFGVTSGEGVVHVYELDEQSGMWSYATRVEASGEHFDGVRLFGYSVTVAGDDIYVGSPSDTSIDHFQYGRVFHYKKNGNDWQFHQMLSEDVALDFGMYGAWVWAREDELLVARNILGGLGKIYHYDTSGLTLIETSESFEGFFGVDGLDFDPSKRYLARRLGDDLFLPQPAENSDSNQYIQNYRREAGKWQLTQTIQPPQFGGDFSLFAENVQVGPESLWISLQTSEAYENNLQWLQHQKDSQNEWQLKTAYEVDGYGVGAMIYDGKLMLANPFSNVNGTNSGQVTYTHQLDLIFYSGLEN